MSFLRNGTPDSSDREMSEPPPNFDPGPTEWRWNSSMLQFTTTLKDSPQMINLYIGRDENNCYRIQESILVEASYGFASRVASFRATHPGSPVTLHFPKDDVFASDVLLFWIFHRTIPDRNELEDIALLRAWNLGASLKIATFQDLCMLELLRKCDVIDIYHVRRIFEAAPKESPMRKFLAENVVFALREHRPRNGDSLQPEDLTKFGEVRGAMAAVIEAQETYRVLDAGIFDRFGRGEGNESRWREFMVAHGPRKHWVHVQGVGWQRREGDEDDEDPDY